MHVEVRKDSVHTFVHTEVRNNRPVPITAATITIRTPVGVVLVNAAAMTVAGNRTMFAWNSAGQPVGTGYLALLDIDGTTYPRYFDIFLYPFTCTVCDADLIARDANVAREHFDATGTAENGTVNTLVDSERMEEDGAWAGGVIDLFFAERTETRENVDFDKESATITFSPDAPPVTAGLGYRIRRSLQEGIDLAARQVQVDFRCLERRVALIIDHSQINELVILKFLERHYFGLRKTADDEYSLKWKWYADEYDRVLKAYPLQYDADLDGAADEGEKPNAPMRWYR